jgi:hypothetical protein
MSATKDVCVGCGYPIVDKTIEGDLTITDCHESIDPMKMEVGSKNGCRNCAVMLDAISTITRDEGQGKRLVFSISSLKQIRSIMIGSGEGFLSHSYMEIVRYAGTSN